MHGLTNSYHITMVAHTHGQLAHAYNVAIQFYSLVIVSGSLAYCDLAQGQEGQGPVKQQ